MQARKNERRKEIKGYQHLIMGRLDPALIVFLMMILSVIAGSATPAAGQCAPVVSAEYDDTLSIGIGVDDHFGSAVAIHADTAVVSSPTDNVGPGGNVIGGGSVRAFVRSGNTWVMQGPKLFASDATQFAQLGFSAQGVDINGDRIVAGTIAAAAYVFTRVGTTWSQTAKLTPADLPQGGGSGFGYSVAISGDTIMVGAPDDSSNQLQDSAGAMYVFVFNGSTWEQQAKLKPSDTFAFSFQRMGRSVAIEGDTAVAGAPEGVAGKAAYVFVRNGTTWSEQAKLVPGDADGAGMGTSVALDGNRVLTGAPFDSTSGGGGAGAVYFFTRSGTSWSQEAKVSNPQGSASDNFGNAVDLYGDAAIVGAYHWDFGSGAIANVGIANILIRGAGGWTLGSTLLESSDLDPNDQFGTSVAIQGDAAVVGAPFDDWTNMVGTTTNDIGAATFYDVRCEGACCVNGACVEMSIGDCNALGGAFQGLGESCTGVTCAPACCRGDLNSDQVIDGLDIQELVDALLQGAVCP